MRNLFLLSILLCLTLHLPGQANTFPLDSTTLVARDVATDLLNPWDMVWGPDDRIWFTTRQGLICRLEPNSTLLDTLHQVTEVFTSPTENSGQHALGIHPAFPDSPYVYTHYAYDTLKARLTRWRYFPNGDSLGDSLRIISEMPAERSHIGSRLQWDTDSTFLISFGDAYQGWMAQDLNYLPGKIHRFLWDGRVPADNPIPGKSAWTWGHRNPQGLVILPDGRVYSSEHGAQNDDEINRIEKGRNYGWPNVEGLCDTPQEQTFCTNNNVAEPLVFWSPTWAVCGLEYYDHPAVPELKGKLLLATLKATALLGLTLNSTGDSILYTDSLIKGQLIIPYTYGRLRDVLVAPDGRIFVCTSNFEPWGPTQYPGDDRIVELSNPLYTSRSEQSHPNIHVFPNPSTGRVEVIGEVRGHRQLNWELLSPTGQSLARGQQELSGTQFRLPLQLPQKGILFLQLKLDGQQVVKRIVNL